MEIYLVVVIALVLLALTNLWVGVSNDAVNFLGSAVGAKVASFNKLLFIAALGMLLGVTFSSGMMEVARNGIVHPEMFQFQDLIIIFLAYAIGDLILLDLFNTFGLPTSTTVSMIFGLVGSGTVISLMKISDTDANISDLANYINTAKVLTFASAIIISVIVSFIVGALAQYFSRMLFTFNYKDKFKRWGGLWSGFAITLISYFLIMKGLKGASFIDKETAEWIAENTLIIVSLSFIFWSFVTQLLISFTKVNVLKGIVLLGTFSLAMAFAANDLVNFLGAPLAGVSAYLSASASSSPFGIPMDALNSPYKADTIVLLSAGLLMIVILYMSKKSKTVTKMAVGLSSQGDEVERFQSYGVSRGLVRSVVNLFDAIKIITPKPIQSFVSSRFDKSNQPKWENPTEAPPAFDLIRASVNLMISAGLISFGTSLTLPLSTTYVTFIVSMATAFSDKAWGRDSAVYRVSGVLTVIGGWFLTAIMASILAGTIALIIWYLGFWGIGLMIACAIILVSKNTILHKKREKEFAAKESTLILSSMGKQELFDSVINNSVNYVHFLSETINSCSEGIEQADLKLLRLIKKSSKDAPKKSDIITEYIAKSIKRFDNAEIERSHHYTDLIGYLNVLSSLTRRMVIQSYNYFDNNHRKMTGEQIIEIKKMILLSKELLNVVAYSIDNREFYNQDMENRFQALKSLMNNYKSLQAVRIISGQSSSFQNLLYLSLFDYCERIVVNAMNLSNAMMKFFKV